MKGENVMDEKIVFEDLDIEFTDEELEGVDVETLERCKQKLEAVIEQLKNVQEVEKWNKVMKKVRNQKIKLMN